MSDAISSGFGMMPTLLRGVGKLSAQNDALTAQMTSGVKSDSYAGLGDQAYEAISLEPQISATNSWQTNLAQIQTNLSATQTALSSINTIASSLQATLLSLKTLSSASSIFTASDSAKQQLTQLTALLNTKSGDSYVFAGTASDQPPVTSPDLASSSLVTSIMTAVSQVGALGAPATEALTMASAVDNSAAGSVFSAQLSVSAVAASTFIPQVQVGRGDSIATGIVVTEGSVATGQSTGSPIRDLIRALATVAGLSGADSSKPDFQSLLTDTSSQLNTATEGLIGFTASVGLLQVNATSRSSAMSDTNVALRSQLDAVKGSDPVTTRTQQIAVQNQLTASYNLIADMKTLNLAQYI